MPVSPADGNEKIFHIAFRGSSVSSHTVVWKIDPSQLPPASLFKEAFLRNSDFVTVLSACEVTSAQGEEPDLGCSQDKAAGSIKSVGRRLVGGMTIDTSSTQLPNITTLTKSLGNTKEVDAPVFRWEAPPISHRI